MATTSRWARVFPDRLAVATFALCVTGITLIGLAMRYSPAGADDFGPFYRAGRLASAGGNVYANPKWSPKDNAEGRFLPYVRIPSYAAALRPIAAEPYALARRIWISALVIAAFGCIGLYPGRRLGSAGESLLRDRFALALAFSFPLANALMIGQDITFVLLIALAAIRIFSGGREFLTGLVASLLSIKPTYLPAAGMVFLAKSRKATWGFVSGILFQLGVSFAVSGVGWPGEYLAVLRSPLIDADPRGMPNIRSLAFSLSMPSAVYLAAAISLCIGFWFVCRRASVVDGLVIALPLGLIASPHSRVYDCVVLIPLFLRIASLDSWSGRIAFLGLTPLLYLVLMIAPAPFQATGVLILIISTLVAAIRLHRISEASNFESSQITQARPMVISRLPW